MNGCGHWFAGGGECGRQPTRPYIVGPRCAEHTPARLAGRPEDAPDPELTAPALRIARGVGGYSSLGSSAAIDRAAEGSGRRRSRQAHIARDDRDARR